MASYSVKKASPVNTEEGQLTLNHYISSYFLTHAKNFRNLFDKKVDIRFKKL